MPRSITAGARSGTFFSRTLRYLNKKKYLYFMFLFVALWYILFCYWPMYGTVVAFQKFSFARGFFRSPFIGLKNFEYIFMDPMFVRALKNTFEINILRIIIGFPLPILFAVMLNEVRHSTYKRLVQTITYLPHFLSWVVMAGLINSMLVMDINGTHAGSINKIIASLGLEQINFLMDNAFFRPLLIGTDIWKELGWNTIIYLAAISGIDPTLYEASVIDGATRLQRIVRITIPSISSTIAILFILAVGSMMQVGFDQTFNLYNAMVYESADILDTYIIRTLQNAGENYLGISTAAGLIKSVINLSMLYSASLLVKKLGYKGIY